MCTLNHIQPLLRRAAGVASAMMVAGFLASIGPTAAADLPGSFKGGAYGVTANAKAASATGRIGRVANIGLGCDGTNGRTRSNEVDALSIGSGGSILTADVVRSTKRADKTSSNATGRTTSKITGLNALKGLIQADAVEAVANVSATADQIRVNADGSSFVKLKIAGNSIPSNVAANTRVNLPGVGHVILKRVIQRGDGTTQRRIFVEMIRIVVEQSNSFGLRVGSRIIVAHAAAGFTRVELDAIVAGQAYLTFANTAVGNQLRNQIGRAALVGMGCEGTDDEVRSNTITSLSVPPVLTLGTGETTAFGGETKAGIVAKTTAEVEDVALLNGIVRARAVRSVAKDTLSGGTRISSTAGTRVLRLRVAGVLIGDVTAANSRINLPGIGHIIVNEQIIPDPLSRQRTVVNGLHLFVTLSNGFGLPVGSEIIIAHADSVIVPPRNVTSADLN